MKSKLDKIISKREKLEEQLLKVKEQEQQEKEDLYIKLGKKSFKLSKLKNEKLSLAELLETIELEISEQEELVKQRKKEKKEQQKIANAEKDNH